MTCGFAKLLIHSSLDRALSQKERLALNTHEETCTACRSEHGTQRRLANLTDRWVSRTLDKSDPGEQFTAQVLSRLETCPLPSPLRFWLPLAVATLLLGALVLVPGAQISIEIQSSIEMPAQALLLLPGWLRTNLMALPGDTLAALRLPQATFLPAWTTLLLFDVILLNAGFCVYARQRSVS